MRNKKWTAEDEQVVRDGYRVLKVDQIAEQLGRTKSSIYLKAHELKLAKPRAVAQPIMPTDAPVS
jgi:predicted DNA-binding transcriptional regulator AlpA